MKQIIIILANSLMVKPEWKSAITAIPADVKQKRDLGHMRMAGAKTSDLAPVVFCRQEDMDEVKKLYRDLDKKYRDDLYDDIIFKELAAEVKKPITEYELGDFEQCKKVELIDMCRDHENIFGDVNHSMLNKGELVEAMAEAVAKYEE